MSQQSLAARSGSAPRALARLAVTQVSPAGDAPGPFTAYATLRFTSPGSESGCAVMVQKGTRTSTSTPTRTVPLGDRLQRSLRPSIYLETCGYVLGVVLAAEGLVILGLHPRDSVKGPNPGSACDFAPSVLSFLYPLRDPGVPKRSPAPEVEPTPR